jgi:predicted phosphoribosyltransferase
MVFENRSRAGCELAALLDGLEREHPIVFALPRGGVPVAAEIARALHARLELLVVRKLGAPGNRELAVGALAEDGSVVLDARQLRRTRMTDTQLERATARERAEVRRQLARFRDGWQPREVRGRTVIVVDDGLATGMTELAGVRALRARGAARVVVAVPVGSRQAVRMLEEEADEVFCHTIPRELLGVGRWYEDFREVSDEQVLSLLAAAGTRVPGASPPEYGGAA